MLLKELDIVTLVKLISYQAAHKSWSQQSLSFELCQSPSQINSALKRLILSGLILPYHSDIKPQPILQACEEFFIHALKYTFPTRLGELARGIPTSYCGPSLKNEFITGTDPAPVWPYGEGDARGLAIQPLHPCVPKSVTTHPDPVFYDILTLLDAIRAGRAREKQLAKQKLSEILKSIADN